MGEKREKAAEIAEESVFEIDYCRETLVRNKY